MSGTSVERERTVLCRWTKHVSFLTGCRFKATRADIGYSHPYSMAGETRASGRGHAAHPGRCSAWCRRCFHLRRLISVVAKSPRYGCRHARGPRTACWSLSPPSPRCRRRRGPHTAGVTMEQVEHEEECPPLHATDHHQGLAEVGLHASIRMRQWNEHPDGNASAKPCMPLAHLSRRDNGPNVGPCLHRR